MVIKRDGFSYPILTPLMDFFHQFKRVVLRLKTDPVLIVLRSVFLYIVKLDLL